MNTQSGDSFDQLRDHWWWRPGWRQGRHFYACHLTFEEAHLLHRLVDKYQDALHAFSGLNIIPRRWLHLTMQGIGFTDQITDRELREVSEAIAARLAGTPAPMVTMHRPVIRPEAIYLPTHPATPIAEVRRQIRTAIAETLGPDRLPEQREQLPGFVPHISIAYANQNQPAAPIAQALATVHTRPATITITHASLLVFHRDRRMYEWSHQDRVPLGIRLA